MRAAQDVDVLTSAGVNGGVAVGSPARPLMVAVATAAAVIVADQLTKLWATDRLTAGPCSPGGDECIELIGSLRLHLVHNYGAAFSTGTSLGPLFGVIAAVMAVFLLNLARSRTDRLGPLVLGAIVGGAVGNLLDRLFRAENGVLSGAVVDFIDAQWWPVFNVADAAVVVGVIVFSVLSFRDPAGAEGTNGAEGGPGTIQGQEGSGAAASPGAEDATPADDGSGD